MQYTATAFPNLTTVTFERFYNPHIKVERASEDPGGRSGPVHYRGRARPLFENYLYSPITFFRPGHGASCSGPSDPMMSTRIWFTSWLEWSLPILWPTTEEHWPVVLLARRLKDSRLSPTFAKSHDPPGGAFPRPVVISKLVAEEET
jgi:hypothetical protein